MKTSSNSLLNFSRLIQQLLLILMLQQLVSHQQITHIVIVLRIYIKVGKTSYMNYYLKKVLVKKTKRV
jgi:hypothetical protein